MKKFAKPDRTIKTCNLDQLAHATGGSGGFELISYSYSNIIGPNSLVSPDSLVFGVGPSPLRIY